ncbi:MAG: hypothetical protein WCK58_11605 [Chloroflexota bacterium]
MNAQRRSIRSKGALVAAAFAAVALAACTGTTGPGASSGPAAAATLVPTPVETRPFATPPRSPFEPSSSAAVTGEVPAPVIAAARTLLAAEIGADAAAAATVTAAEAVTWPDGSLGCPEPGVMYTQALVPGYRVVLESGGTSYDFRMPEGGEGRLCRPWTPPVRPSATP